MKHPSNQQFFAYWNQKRGEARAPDRGDIDPDAVRELLGDIFVLACDEPSRFPFRVAGTRLCALAGRDLKNRSFSELFATEARREIEDIVAAVTEDMVPAALLTHLANRVARAGAMVEVNEKWSCPSARTVAAMADARVRLVAGSDSHHCRDIGVYDSVRVTVAAMARI